MNMKWPPSVRNSCVARMAAGEALEAISEDTGVNLRRLREWRAMGPTKVKDWGPEKPGPAVKYKGEKAPAAYQRGYRWFVEFA